MDGWEWAPYEGAGRAIDQLEALKAELNALSTEVSVDVEPYEFTLLRELEERSLCVRFRWAHGRGMR